MLNLSGTPYSIRRAQRAAQFDLSLALNPYACARDLAEACWLDLEITLNAFDGRGPGPWARLVGVENRARWLLQATLAPPAAGRGDGR